MSGDSKRVVTLPNVRLTQEQIDSIGAALLGTGERSVVRAAQLGLLDEIEDELDSALAGYYCVCPECDLWQNDVSNADQEDDEPYVCGKCYNKRKRSNIPAFWEEYDD